MTLVLNKARETTSNKREGKQDTEQPISIGELISKNQDEVTGILNSKGVRIRVTKASEVRKLLAKRYGIPEKKLCGGNIGVKENNILIMALYAYILQEKFLFNADQIRQSSKLKASNTKIEEWVEKGRSEVNKANSSTKKIFDAVEYQGK